MKNKSKNSSSSPEKQNGPSYEAFRKVKWIKRKRGLIGFFTFLALITTVLFFDYYWALISRVIKQPSRVVEQIAGSI